MPAGRTPTKCGAKKRSEVTRACKLVTNGPKGNRGKKGTRFPIKETFARKRLGKFD